MGFSWTEGGNPTPGNSGAGTMRRSQGKRNLTVTATVLGGDPAVTVISLILVQVNMKRGRGVKGPGARTGELPLPGR